MARYEPHAAVPGGRGRGEQVAEVGPLGERPGQVGGVGGGGDPAPAGRGGRRSKGSTAASKCRRYTSAAATPAKRPSTATGADRVRLYSSEQR